VADADLRGLAAGDTHLCCDALGGAIDLATVYAAVEREVGWSEMYHRGGLVPRLVAVQGSLGDDGVEPLYRHPVDGQPAMRPWTPTVDALRRAAEAVVGHPLNHGLLQLYRHGRDWISEHADKTLDVARPSSIVNVSLGSVRTMALRPKEGRATDGSSTLKVPLPHGSVFVLGLETNRRWYHAIKQRGAGPDDGPRISLTFRSIGTWLDPVTGAVWGVGAPSRTRAEATARAGVRAALPSAERARVERDEAERMLRLFREENIDPSFDAGAYGPGFEVVDLRSLRDEG
jgi:alkylated DNA repair dioxygenase AlkB